MHQTSLVHLLAQISTILHSFPCKLTILSLPYKIIKCLSCRYASTCSCASTSPFSTDFETESLLLPVPLPVLVTYTHSVFSSQVNNESQLKIGNQHFLYAFNFFSNDFKLQSFQPPVPILAWMTSTSPSSIHYPLFFSPQVNKIFHL